MPIDYEIAQGDCIDSVAMQHGFFPETLWNHGSNAELKELRKDPNVLFPGDKLFIPDIQIKEVDKPTEQKHRFRRKGVPARLRMKFFRPATPAAQASSGGGQYEPSRYEGPPPPPEVKYEPITNARFVLNVDGHSSEGQSDGEGMVDVPIPPHAASGTIKFHPGMPEEISFDLSLGEMDPIETVSGMRKRLNNLGYRCLPAGDEMEDSLRDALQRFQTAQNLTVNGEIDQATKDKLQDLHGT